MSGCSVNNGAHFASGADPDNPGDPLGGLDPPYKVSDVLEINSPNLNYEYVENSAVVATGGSKKILHDGFQSPPWEPVPKRFSKAVLRFKGLRASGPVPAFLSVLLNGKEAGKLPRFALHPMAGMRHGITMTLDVTDRVKHRARGASLSFTIKLAHPVHPRRDFKVGFDQIVLAFPS